MTEAVFPTVPPSRLVARDWFRSARFGLFVHWGIYSTLGDGEWVMEFHKIPKADYEKLAGFFNPAYFDAAEWVSLAREAGMKYITFTSKHHDGFAMWDSKVSDWNVVQRTPFARDVVGELAEECRRQGIKFFLYHSLLDWHHLDFFPLGGTGHHSGRPPGGKFSRYIDFMMAQLEELLTNYGDITGIWFDGHWDVPNANWRYDEIYALIHRLQPNCLIGNNHHLRPLAGEDYQMYERDLPGHNTAGYSGTAEVGDLPLETCDTMNKTWGYKLTDNEHKSTRDLLRYLARSAGYDANLLLNVGPMPNGRIQEEFQTRLREMGEWLSRFGETIYGTRGGPTPPRPWGAMTQSDAAIFLHVLNWQDPQLAIPAPECRIKAAHLVTDGTPVAYHLFEGSLLLQVPPPEAGQFSRVVKLEVEPH